MRSGLFSCNAGFTRGILPSLEVWKRFSKIIEVMMRMKTRPCSKRGQSRAMIKSRAPPPPIQESHSQMKPQHWGRAAEIPIGGAQGKVKLCQNAYIVNLFLHCEVVLLHCYILTHHSFLVNIFTRLLIRAPGINIWDSSSPLQKTALDCCGQKKPLI